MGTTNILDLNNRVSELAESYPADNVMMSDGVTSVEDILLKDISILLSYNSVTANTKINAGTLSELTDGKITTATQVKAISVIAAFGYSDADVSASAIINNSQITIMPTKTQNNFKIYISLLYR